MKPFISAIIFGLTLLAVLGNSRSSDNNDRTPFLTVTSLDPDQTVTFDAAFVSGDSSAASPMDYSRRKTPFRLEIPSPYFFGIFKKVSGNADIEVSIQSRIAIVRATSSTVLITKNNERIKSEGF